MIKNTFLAFLLFCLFPTLSNQKYDSLRVHAREWQGRNIDSAFYYASEMLKVGQKNENQRQISDAIMYQGLAYGYMNEFEREQIYYQKALAYSQKVEDSLGIGKSLLNLGVNYFYRGTLDSAAQYYEMARKIFRKIDDKKHLAFSLNNLGQVYKHTSNFDGAIDVYSQSLEIKKELQDSVGIKNAYFNLSSLYISTNNYEKALGYSQQAYDISVVQKDTVDIAASLVNLGVSQKGLGQIDQALNQLLEADRLKQLVRHKATLLDLNLNLAEIYVDKLKFETARGYLDEVKAILPENAFLEKRMLFFDISYRIEKRLGNMSSALEMLEQYLEAKESYLSESVQKNVADLERRYQTEQKERQITQLELDKKNAALALAKSNNQRNTFIFIALLIVFIAVFLYYLYNTKRKTSDILAIKNNQISKALDEREVLLKEIHHRVKNNLQVVWSLLRLQGRSLNDEVAREALTQGQNRVKSMALVHQRLYSTDDLRGVSVQDYFEKLTSELFMAFGVSHVDYKVET
ncbi:MAG: tetratricopeptide repeat protein, partial [Cyclobacteriaceae bacterium]